ARRGRRCRPVRRGASGDGGALRVLADGGAGGGCGSGVRGAVERTRTGTSVRARGPSVAAAPGRVPQLTADQRHRRAGLRCRDLAERPGDQDGRRALGVTGRASPGTDDGPYGVMVAVRDPILADELVRLAALPRNQDDVTGSCLVNGICDGPRPIVLD